MRDSYNFKNNISKNKFQCLQILDNIGFRFHVNLAYVSFQPICKEWSFLLSILIIYRMLTKTKLS